VWIKYIYEYSKLTEISTVWKSRIVQNEVCTCEKYLSFNIKKQCAKNALCFPDVYARQDFHSRILMRDSSGLEDFKDIQVRVVLTTPEFILEHFGNDPFSSRIRIKRQQLFAATPYNKLNKFIRIGLSEHRTRFSDSTYEISLVRLKTKFPHSFSKLLLGKDEHNGQPFHQSVNLFALPLNHLSISVHGKLLPKTRAARPVI
jgi:hypothetical protein